MGYYNYDTGAFLGYCVRCGTGFPKRELDRLMVKNGRYGNPKILAYCCRECMANIADALGVALPDIDTPRHRAPHYLFCPACRLHGQEGDRYCRKCGTKLEDLTC